MNAVYSAGRLGRWFGAVAALALIAPLAPAHAQDATADPTTSRTAPQSPQAAPSSDATTPASLTGEWGGLRTQLRDDGIDLTANWVSEAGTNVGGSTSERAAETSQLTVGSTFDTGKLFGLKGGTIQATVTWRRGDNLDDVAHLNLLEQAQEVYGDGQTVRVTELWYKQKLGAVTIKVGRMPVGDDFDSFPCLTENLTFCGAPTGNIDGDAWKNWPISQWAGSVRYDHGAVYASIGAYEQNPLNSDDNFFIGHFSGANGVLVPAEVGIKTHFGGSDGAPGLLRVGGWWNTAPANDVLLASTGQPAIDTSSTMLQHNSRYGIYGLAQQQFFGTWQAQPDGTQKVTHGLWGYAVLTFADKDTSTIDNQVIAGLKWVGIPGRSQDMVQFSVGRTHVNDRAALLDWLQAGKVGPHLGTETAMEVDYGLQLTGWLSVLPNVQVVEHPGGDPTAPVTTVLGVKTTVTI